MVGERWAECIRDRLCLFFVIEIAPWASCPELSLGLGAPMSENEGLIMILFVEMITVEKR